MGQLNGPCHALEVFQNQLYAGGAFTTAGGVTVNRIARWDGVSWHALGTGVAGGVSATVNALEVYQNELYVAGIFSSVNGVPAANIARWDGQNWQSVGNGANGDVRALTVYNGELIAGGFFTSAGGQTANYIARWNGSIWQPLGLGMGPVDLVNPGVVLSLTVHDGELIAGGKFTSVDGGTGNAIRLAAWDGANWHSLGTGIGGPGGASHGVYALLSHEDHLYIGGDFTVAGNASVNNVARWDGKNWEDVGGGMTGSIFAFYVYDDQIIAGGNFSTANAVQVNHIAKWTGSAWEPLASGVGSTSTYSVRSLAIFPYRLVVGGNFAMFLPQGFVSNVASWEGCAVPPGDVTADGVVNVQDLLAVINNWGLCAGQCPPACPADIAPASGPDCEINVLDLLRVINNWG